MYFFIRSSRSTVYIFIFFSWVFYFMRRKSSGCPLRRFSPAVCSIAVCTCPAATCPIHIKGSVKYEQICKKKILREINVRKFQDFSATQILREIDFAHFRVSKTAIFALWKALIFWSWSANAKIHQIQYSEHLKSEIQTLNAEIFPYFIIFPSNQFTI